VEHTKLNQAKQEVLARLKFTFSEWKYNVEDYSDLAYWFIVLMVSAVCLQIENFSAEIWRPWQPWNGSKTGSETYVADGRPCYNNSDGLFVHSMGRHSEKHKGDRLDFPVSLQTESDTQLCQRKVVYSVKLQPTDDVFTVTCSLQQFFSLNFIALFKRILLTM